MYTSHYPKEGPWELPNGWVWCNLEELCFFLSRGKSPVYSEDSKEYPVFAQKCNLKEGGISLEKALFLNPETLPKWPIEYRLKTGDVLVNSTGTGTVGRTRLFNEQALGPYPFVVPDSHVSVIRTFSQISSEYVYILLSSEYGQQYFADNLAGSTNQKELYIAAIAELQFPLPPEEEQRRIAKQVFALDDSIRKLDEEKLLIQSGVESAKAKILDLAIHGKLVPQIPSDEPAIEMLRRVNPDFIPSDNLHYEGELPNGWYAITLGQVVDIISGTSYQKSDIVSSGTGIRILRGGNIQNGRILLCDDDVYVQSNLANERNALCLGDIVIVASTGSHELIGKAAQVDTRYQNTQIGAFLRVIRPRAIELANYLGVIFQSNYYKNHIRDVAKGTNINNIKSAYLTEFVVPIPPLEEQRRILQRINALFVIADQITDPIDDTK